MRDALVLGSVLLTVLTATGASPAASTPSAVSAPSAATPLPGRMADTGGGSQLITAEAADTSSTTGRVTWWDLRGGRWTAAGSAAARFGSGGLVEGARRVQGTSTTPAGLFDLPYAFGIAPAPAGTTYRYRRVTGASWWCEDNESRAYNRWTERLPADCRASESERLADYPAQYARALVTSFNYHRPVRGRGAGIFLHVNGRGATAGCVSVPAGAMSRILAWADPRRAPHIAVGTRSGRTAITRY